VQVQVLTEQAKQGQRRSGGLKQELLAGPQIQTCLVVEPMSFFVASPEMLAYLRQRRSADEARAL
jgi:hypothetical protein